MRPSISSSSRRCRELIKTKWPGFGPGHWGSSGMARSGLLNRRQQPLTTTRAAEGPELGRFRRLLLDDAAGCPADHLVVERIAHRDGGVLVVALAPGFRQIALQQLDVGDLVDDAAAGVLRELLGEVRQHLRREVRAERAEVFPAAGGL